MYDKELTRDNINYQMTGLEMQLKYLRDALMCTYLGIPLHKFFRLNGNLPVVMEERMPFLDNLVSRIDVEYWKEVKGFLYNSEDNELTKRFSKLDVVVWQLVVMSSRFAEEHDVVRRTGVMANELLLLVRALKEDLLQRKFFDFGYWNSMAEAVLLDEMIEEATQNVPAAEKHARWGELEEAVEVYDERAKENALRLKGLFTDGRFLLKSPVIIKEVYEFLCYGYKFGGNKKSYFGVIDPEMISEEDFETALMTGCYYGFKDNSRNNHLYFFICHFSKAYVEDEKTYRKIAADSLEITVKNMESNDKNDGYAEGLRRILPLVRYNNT